MVYGTVYDKPVNTQALVVDLYSQLQHGFGRGQVTSSAETPISILGI